MSFFSSPRGLLSLTSGWEAVQYLKQALLLAESVTLHGPKVDVRLSAGDDHVGIHGMKHSGQHGVVGALP